MIYIKKFFCFIILFEIIRVIFSLFVGIEKIAITEKNAKSGNYIICMETVTTGFEWTMVQNENRTILGNSPTTGQCIKISGIDNPTKYFGYYGTNSNRFIFYFDNKKEEYDKNLMSRYTVYHCYDWDVVYPVRHSGFLGWLNANFCITGYDKISPEGDTKYFIIFLLLCSIALIVNRFLVRAK